MPTDGTFKLASEKEVALLNPGKDKKDLFKIKIDKDHFEVTGPSVTADQLRALPDPDIGADRDLFLTVRGPGADQLIEGGAVIELEKNMDFFTAPRQINPGADALCD